MARKGKHHGADRVVDASKKPKRRKNATDRTAASCLGTRLKAKERLIAVRE